MAFRSGLSKLNIPIDVDEEFLCCRQRLIEEKLLKCYAEEVSATISMKVLEIVKGAALITRLRDNTIV